VALSSDGARAAIRTTAFDELRDWSSGLPLWSSPGIFWTPMSLAPDGHALATPELETNEGDYFVALRDAAKGTILWENKQARLRGSLLFTAGGREVVLLDADRRLVSLDARDGSVLRRTGPTEDGTWILAGGARALVVGAQGKSIAAYDMETGKPLWRSAEGRVSSSDGVRVVAGPDGRTFLELDDTFIRRRSVETGAEIGERIDLGPSADAPRQIALSSDGQTLVVGTRRGVLLRFRVKPSP
jgi:outer membrane protein assembly factor BamB